MADGESDLEFGYTGPTTGGGYPGPYLGTRTIGTQTSAADRRYRLPRPQGTGVCTSQMVPYRRKDGSTGMRRKVCFRRKRSMPDSHCLMTKKAIREALITKARGSAEVRGQKSHTLGPKSKAPGAVVTRNTDVRIGKGVIDAIHKKVLQGCSGVVAHAILDAAVTAWAATFNATKSRKVHGRSTIKLVHVDAGEKSAIELLGKPILQREL